MSLEPLKEAVSRDRCAGGVYLIGWACCVWPRVSLRARAKGELTLKRKLE
jgi:hypothetical protein